MEIDPELVKTTSSQGVFLKIRDKVLEITLDRPKANAINCAVSRALAQAFLYLHANPELRVGVLTGGGERFFSAGWDLKAAAAGEAVDADHGPGGFGGLTELFELEKPVIAAVNGLAVGGGFELALACDLIVAVDHAEFFLPESGLGIIPDSGGALRLPRLLPRAVAMELLLTGRRMSAAQAAQLGLVNQVAPRQALLSQAHALADAIAAKAPLATAAIKTILAKTAQMSLEQGYRALRAGQIPAYTRLLRSDDAKEGIAAYSQGRAPSWKGQ